MPNFLKSGKYAHRCQCMPWSSPHLTTQKLHGTSPGDKLGCTILSDCGKVPCVDQQLGHCLTGCRPNHDEDRHPCWAENARSTVKLTARKSIIRFKIQSSHGTSLPRKCFYMMNFTADRAASLSANVDHISAVQTLEETHGKSKLYTTCLGD